MIATDETTARRALAIETLEVICGVQSAGSLETRLARLRRHLIKRYGSLLDNLAKFEVLTGFNGPRDLVYYAKAVYAL